MKTLILIFTSLAVCLAQAPPNVNQQSVNGINGQSVVVPLTGDVTTDANGVTHVTSVNAIAFCNGFFPLEGQFLQFTTTLVPKPCLTASFAVGPPDPSISLSHTGNFTQSQVGATYTITVSNVGFTPTTGTVTVTDVVPLGLTATAMAGSGWSCTFSTGICTRSDSLAIGASYPNITLTVTVSATAGNVTNTATVSGGSEINVANDSASDQTIVVGVGAPDMSITGSHGGSFSQGQVGAVYTLAVKNSGTATTVGAVTVVDTLPLLMTATALSGTGWSCTLSTLTCTRSDALASLASYPNLTLTLTVASNAPASVTNVVNVSGGGETNTTNNSSSDPTTISVVTTPDMTITKTHTGNFTQGQVGATYTIVASNSGTGVTSGTVTVVDTIPTGLTATALTGTGWSCTLSTKTCTRSDALAAGASYPALTLTVTVSGSAASTLTNSVAVSGGGEVVTTNDTAVDVTGVIVTGIPISDPFNQSMLDTSLWTFVDPVGGDSVSMTGTQMKLTILGGVTHDPAATPGIDQSVRIKQTIGNNDFISTIKFDSIPTQQYQFEGIMVRQNTNNDFIRFQFGTDGTNLFCNTDKFVAGTPTGVLSTTFTPIGASIWLQVQRNGSTWTQLYSLDGTNYITVGSFSQAYTVNEIDVWGGNYNATAGLTPAFNVLADSFTGATNGSSGGGSGSGPCGLGSPGAVTNSGALNLGSSCTGSVIENVHVTTTAGPCVTITNASNITIHNSELGPCGSADTNSLSNEQAVSISGGAGIRILDSYLHAEAPGIVHKTAKQVNYDVGDNILCNGSTGLLIQGNVISWGEANILLHCSGTQIIGNFLLNPIASFNLFNRGANISIWDGSSGVTADRNYLIADNDTTNHKYSAFNGDQINMASGSVQTDAATITNNYIYGGTVISSCGINADGGFAQTNPSATSTWTGNTVISAGFCGISIEGGYNYVVSNNKIFNQYGLIQTANDNHGIQIFQCYGGNGSACNTGQIIPCGNIALAGNTSYANSQNGSVSGFYLGTPACTNVTGTINGANGNLYDSAAGGAAFNALNPPASKLPPPAIPPVPFSCVVKNSPFANNVAFPGC